jgi:tRNA (adenine37-N6)-methyltransferase
MNKQTYTIYPIGKINSKNGMFTITLIKEKREALIELDGFSHIQIFWWGHLFDQKEYRNVNITEKPYKKSPDKIGIFATRSPVRPNPILVTTVPVIDIDHEKGEITIPFIDAEENSPLVDIKGYYPFERVKDLKVPQWCSHWPQWYEDSASFDWAAEFENAQ